ncbi:MAG: DEAD/DEAH box helicase family protein, partial [bacterium]
MPHYCQVALNLPLKDAFDYEVPEGLTLSPGQRVRVSFGRRRLEGVVTALLDHSQVKGLKPVEMALEAVPSVSPELLQFTRWVSDYYLCGWGEALALALAPAGVPKQDAWLEVVDPAGLGALIAGLAERQVRSRAVLEGLLTSGALRLDDARAEGLSLLVSKRALAGGILRRALRDIGGTGPMVPAKSGPVLNPAQAQAVDAVQSALGAGKGGAFLLHGVTGSGKTEVYLQALDAVLRAGGGGIVLVPEIALT